MARKSKTEKVPGWKSDATELRIQKAALDIFAKKGFAAASTREIASKAKANIALISKYFGGKEQLFKYIIQTEVGKILRNDLSYPIQNCFRDEIREYINATLSNAETNLGFFKIMVAQSLMDKKLSLFMKETVIPEYDDRLLSRLSSLQEKGLLNKNITPREISLSVQAFIVGTMVTELMLGATSKSGLQSKVDSFLNVVCRV